MKQRKIMKAIVYALGLLVVILLGTFVFRLISDASFRTQRSTLLQSPRPVPAELDRLYPAPGSRISSSEFINEVYFETYGNLLGIDLEDHGYIDGLAHMSLIINEVPVEYSKGIFRYGTLKGMLSRISWGVGLPPGDYLAELRITGVDSELTYSWAFQITND